VAIDEFLSAIPVGIYYATSLCGAFRRNWEKIRSRNPQVLSNAAPETALSAAVVHSMSDTRNSKS